MHNSPTYQTWADMKIRCNNPQHKSYPHYGGRGITYDPRWEIFSNFFEDMGEKPPGLTIERLDNDGPYCKANCVWADRTAQNRNKRQRTRAAEREVADDRILRF